MMKKKEKRIIDKNIRLCYKYENINIVFKNINHILDKVQKNFDKYTYRSYNSL